LADPQRILIVKLGAVGDCLHTLIAARALRQRFPEAELGWLVETKSQDVVTGHPLLDRVHIWQRKRSSADFKSGHVTRALAPINTVVKEIRATRYDVAIDFQNLFKSGFFCWRSGAGLRLGFRRLREANFLFTNHRVRLRGDEYHMVRRYLALLRPLGVEVEGKPPAETVFVDAADRQVADDFVAVHDLGGKTVVALNPAASLPRKLWPASRLAEVADRLVDSAGIVPLIIWGPGEEPLVEAVKRNMKNAPLVAPATSIKELAHLLSKCTMYLGNDSGPMHLAAAMGAGVVGLFGPTDAARVAPWTERGRSVEPAEAFNKSRAIAGITAEQVYRAASELLEAL
jgi:lipopolysaccharide heptosyltransferase I